VNEIFEVEKMLKRKYWILILLTPIVVIIDQLTKTMALNLLESQTITLIPGYFNLVLVKNTGMVFGLLNNMEGAWRMPLLVGVSCVAILIIFHLLRQARPSAFLLPLSLSFILSGAIGNLLDRFRWGYVVDFINMHYHDKHWPTFNIADSAITVGIILLILDTLRTPTEKEDKGQESQLVVDNNEPTEEQTGESG
jgi:signal peptidase II